VTRPGPKPGPPGSQRTARLVVRVTPAELSAYQAAAGRAGVSMGEWVRRLAQQPPQPLDRVQEPADEGGHVEQRDHAQRGED